EMSLVKVAERCRKCRPIQNFALVKAINGFVYAVAPDHPTGAYADVTAKEPLQCPLCQVELFFQFVALRKLTVGNNPVDDLMNERRRRIQFRRLAAQKAFGNLDPVRFSRGRADTCL